MGIAKVIGTNRDSGGLSLSAVEAGEGMCLYYQKGPFVCEAESVWEQIATLHSEGISGSVRIQCEFRNTLYDAEDAAKIRIAKNGVTILEEEASMDEKTASIDTALAVGDKIEVFLWCMGFYSQTIGSNLRVSISPWGKTFT